MNGQNFLTNNQTVLDALTEHLFDGIVIYNTSQSKPIAVFANEAFTELTGYSIEEIIGKEPVFKTGKDKSTTSSLEIHNSIINGKELDKELVCFRQNGTPFWAKFKSKSIVDKSTDQSYQILILRDVSQRRRKESDLEKALENAESSKAVKNRFLANMSHEMRTPINGIMGMAQLLESTDLSDQQKEYLEELKISSENLLAIVNDILEFNFIESGGLNIEKREFSIRKQLEQIVKTKSESAQEKSVDLNLVISDKVPHLLIGDVIRFGQILMNLINNGIKFTQAGSVKILVRSLEETSEKVTIEVKIKDTGIGIPDSLLNQIFDSFNQASKSTTYKYGGTGLGLSIVDQLVKKMEGSIHVKSKEGEGTEFTVLVPFEKGVKLDEQQNKVTQSKNNGESDAGIPSGTKVLVVDDYLINRKIVKGLLEKIGVQVDQAITGEEALKKIGGEDYSLIFMDVHMPGMGGLATTREIRKLSDPKKSSLPVVAITASVLQDDIEECKKAGMDDFIAKPFTKKELINTLNSVLSSENKKLSMFESIEEVEEENGIQLESLMEMTGGDQEMVKEMIELFIEQTPNMISELNESLKVKDFKQLSIVAHTLKPTFNYMDMGQAFTLSEEIEAIGKSDDIDEKSLKENVSELSKICEQYLKRFKKAIEKLS